jgi:archaellum component FlaC
MIDTLKNSNKQLGDIKDIMNTFQNDFDEEIDIVNGMDKSDNNNAIRIRNHVEVFTIAKNVFMEYFNLVKDVMIERNNTYKRCLSAALHYNAK